MNKSIKFFIMLLIVIIITIPNLPYKLPKEIKDSKYIKLSIAISQTTGGPTVIDGKDEIEKYSKEMNYTNVATNEVYTKGNRPSNVITTFSQGDPKYVYFDVYGNFEKGPDQYNVLTFNIKEWYPLDKYICLKDTIKWNEYKKVYKFIIIINSLLIILLIKHSKRGD